MTPAAIDIRSKSDGFILVAVLWILGALAVLASIYALYVVNAATSLQANNDRIQSEASISSALELTAYYMSAVDIPARPTRGTFGFQIGDSSVAVAFQTEAGRIDLNTAPKPILAGLFMVLGAQAGSANDYADRIVGWRSPSNSEIEDQDKEITAYRNAGLNYKPRQSPFTSAQELWLVLALPPALVERALPFVTVYSGLPTVNIMVAAPEVVAALPGMSPDRLDAVLKLRNNQSTDPAAVLQLLGPAQGSATVRGGTTTRVSVQVDLKNNRRINAEAVILLLENADDPYRVLSWNDDFDG